MRLSTFLALAALGLTASALPAAAGTLLVPQQFPTIKKALAAAKPYDTVLVSAKPKGGVYNEAVTINTPHVVLQGRGNPVLDITGLETEVYPLPNSPTYHHTVYPNGIEIRADHVAIRGLTVENTGGTDYGIGASGINVGYTSADLQTQYGFSGIEISGVTARNDYNGITITGYSSAATPGAPVTLLRGNRLLGNLVTGSTNFYGGGAIIGGGSLVITGNRFTNNAGLGLAVVSNGGYNAPDPEDALIAGNQFTGNGSDGLYAAGTGLTVAGNEAASNAGAGMIVAAPVYDPADAKAPSTAVTAVTFNSVHENKVTGLWVVGTQTVAGNLLSRNVGYGLFLLVAEHSTVCYNLITGTTLLGGGYSLEGDGESLRGDGSGIYADSTYAQTGFGGLLTVTANGTSGNAGDGIFLDGISGSTASFNDASGNAGIGIHLSGFATYLAPDGAALNTVTQNRALHNALPDARDDAAASAPITYNAASYYGLGLPTVNVWTKNQFGTTDPVGLSK